MISDFAKEKVFWTRKMNLKLVKFIQSRPSIWNPKHHKYTSVEFRDQTYAEFAAKYGNEFSGQAVKHRWTNIRSTFANYLRKFNASREKEDGEEYKVNWHLWEACQFLLKVNKKAKAEAGTSNILDVQEENMNLLDSTDQDLNGETLLNNTQEPYPSCKEIAQNLYTIFKSMQNDAFGLDNTKHGRIGQTLTKSLSQMNSYEAAKLSNKVMEILLFYDEKNPLNPNNMDL